MPVLSTDRVVQPTPHGVIQRTGKSAWRHLDDAPTNPHWQHSGNPKPLLQIAIGREVVRRLRANLIDARLGGSVAALGYCTTRNPDDIDIDILPKDPHVGRAKAELDQAKVLVDNLRGQLFQCQTGGFNWGYHVYAITVASESTYVIGLQIDGQLIRNRYNTQTYQIEIHQEAFSFKLQIINETAFTHYNLSKDPGTVDKEKYKEVTGFSRLVANCLGRLIQSNESNGSDSKNDRQRIREMLRAKMASASAEKLRSLCEKILFYFKDGDEKSKRSAALLLGEIVHELNSSIKAIEFAQSILTTFGIFAVDLQKLLQDLAQGGLMETLKHVGGSTSNSNFQ